MDYKKFPWENSISYHENAPRFVRYYLNIDYQVIICTKQMAKTIKEANNAKTRMLIN